MKINKYIKGGLVLVLAVGLLAAAGSFAPAFGYAAIVKVANDLVKGQTVWVFSGDKPNQKSGDSSGSLVPLEEGTNYSLDKTSSDDYWIYNIYDSSSQPAYLLILKSDTYSILGPAKMGTTVPVTTTYTTATPYKNGKPDAPSALTVEAGYETAQAAWTLNDATDGTGFDYSGLEIQVAKDLYFSNLIKDSSGNTATSSSKVTKYKIGKLVDGRTLETNSEGIKYYVRVIGTVDGVDDSEAAETSFTTKGWGTAVEEVTTKKTLSFKKPSGKTGINTFSIPFNVDEPGEKPVKAKAEGENAYTSLLAEGAEKIKVRDVIEAIGEKVTVFGWFDADEQRMKGLTTVTFKNGKVDADNSKALSPDTVEEILNTAISNLPYQVSVSEEKEIKLEGYTKSEE